MLSGGSLFIAFAFVVAKLLFWNYFTVGVAPIVIGLFFFMSVQLFFVGVIGEYVGAIHTQVEKRPLVIEEERINFPGAEDAMPQNGAPPELWQPHSTGSVENSAVWGISVNR